METVMAQGVHSRAASPSMHAARTPNILLGTCHSRCGLGWAPRAVPGSCGHLGFSCSLHDALSWVSPGSLP